MTIRILCAARSVKSYNAGQSKLWAKENTSELFFDLRSTEMLCSGLRWKVSKLHKVEMKKMRTKLITETVISVNDMN